MREQISEGFDVFLDGSTKSFGAVRQVHKFYLVVYVENAGDFEIPLEVVKAVEAEKVILDPSRIDSKILDAIRRAHAREDPHIP